MPDKAETRSPAELSRRLRAAASLLRGRAEAASQGPWSVPAQWPAIVNTGPGRRYAVLHADALHEAVADATYIAAVHPGVALALADVFEAGAQTHPGPGLALGGGLDLYERLVELADVLLGPVEEIEPAANLGARGSKDEGAET